MSGFLLKCAKCRWWSGYRPTKYTKTTLRTGDGGIDTICGVCGTRLRHTPPQQGWSWMMKTVSPAYARRSGGHNRSQSVLDCIPFARSRVKFEAAVRNKIMQKRIAEKDGVDLDKLFEEEESLTAISLAVRASLGEEE